MPNKPDSITALSALELMERLHKRQVSCAEVMQAYLTVMDELNPSHRAIVARVNSEQLLSQAAAHDQQFTKNATHSLLYGFPQAPKDLLPAAGIAFTRGSPVLANNLPEEDAELLARLRQQGAIFVGKTNVPEFGLGCHTYNPLYGITRNAIQPELSAAGSSGGTAVAVATHMLPVADGSDMMGSLRAPAAFNGIYGLRPTPDLIPDSPVTSANRPTLAVNGPMARSIPDLALMLAVMADFPSQLPFIREPKADHFITPLQRDFAGTTIAWLGNLNDRLPMEDGMLDACLSSLQRLQDAGCEIIEWVPDFDYDALWQAWIDLRSTVFFEANEDLLSAKENFNQIKPEAQWEFTRGRQMTAERLQQAIATHAQWQETLKQAFSRVSFMAMPACQVFPFPAEWDWPKTIAGHTMDTYHRWMENMLPASMGGLPTLAMPAGNAATNKGSGLQLMAAPGQDLAVLQLGYTYQQSI